MIKPVCVVVIAIWAALLLRIANDARGSYVMLYYVLIVALPLLSALTIAVLRPASQTPMNQALPCQVRAAKRQKAQEAEAPMLAFEVATPSSTQPTVSTLTTEVGGGGEEEREDGAREEGGEEGERLPSLKSVFDCSYIKIKTMNDGKDGWECGWCGNIFAPRHASRALQHVLKMKGGNIAV
jgi:hypothetical protein